MTGETCSWSMMSSQSNAMDENPIFLLAQSLAQDVSRDEGVFLRIASGDIAPGVTEKHLSQLIEYLDKQSKLDPKRAAALSYIGVIWAAKMRAAPRIWKELNFRNIELLTPHPDFQHLLEQLHRVHGIMEETDSPV